MEQKENALRLPTVAALSTPFGRGGIAVFRISGDRAIEVASRVFKAKNGALLTDLPANSAVYGGVFAAGEQVDEGILTIYRAPRSFTGEDTCELSCHGGVLLSAKVLEALLDAGAEQAGPGEFTKRAYLNGKMSLEKAESVADLIDAENDHQLRLASKNAGGALQRRINALSETLVRLLADAYVTIDYPDEDLRELSPEEFEEQLLLAREQTKRLVDSYTVGHAVAHGVKTAIVGRPNVGKSSLLNLLLGRDRAIVSSIPGTTRDTIEERATLGMITLLLTDTAGLRKNGESGDPIEALGIERSRRAMDEAEMIFAVFDGSEKETEQDLELINDLRAGKPCVAILNKADLPEAFDRSLLNGFDVVSLSAKSGRIPEDLTACLQRIFGASDFLQLDEGLLTNARTLSCAKRALEALDRALLTCRGGEGLYLAGLDVEEALCALRGIDGNEVGEEIAASIFSRFCVGK